MKALEIFLGGTAAAIGLLAASTPAAASVCGAPAPAVGTVLRGPVLQVIDGRTLCIASGPTPDAWTEVTLASDGLPPTHGARVDQAVLMSAAFAQTLTCTILPAAGGAPQARCVVDGVPLANLMSRPGVVEAAAEWIPGGGETRTAMAALP